MRAKKTSKKMIIILLAAILAVCLFAVWSSNNYWIRPAGEIESIDVWLLLKEGYKEITITDTNEIKHIRDMVIDIQNDPSLIRIGDVENWQKDSNIGLLFNYKDGRRQNFDAHKGSAVCFTGFNGEDYYWKYVYMYTANTDELFNYFQEGLS